MYCIHIMTFLSTPLSLSLFMSSPLVQLLTMGKWVLCSRPRIHRGPKTAVNNRDIKLNYLQILDFKFITRAHLSKIPLAPCLPHLQWTTSGSSIPCLSVCSLRMNLKKSAFTSGTSVKINNKNNNKFIFLLC